jgi:hypothetical protein
MKKFIITILGVLLYIGSFAQSNMIGKTRPQIIWDLIGTDSISCNISGVSWCSGDTLILSISNRQPDTLPYHPLYYLVNDVCVKEIVITCKKYKWPHGDENLIVDNVVVYTNPNDNYSNTNFPVKDPSSFDQNDGCPIIKDRNDIKNITTSDPQPILKINN